MLTDTRNNGRRSLPSLFIIIRCLRGTQYDAQGLWGVARECFYAGSATGLATVHQPRPRGLLTARTMHHAILQTPRSAASAGTTDSINRQYTIELDEEQRPRFRDPHGWVVVARPPRPIPPDLGWPRIRAQNEGLGIDAETNACKWDGKRVHYAAMIDQLVIGDGLH
jgi:hypothetical protein